MPLDLSLGQKNAFHGSGHFVAGDFAVDALNGRFFAGGHAAPQPQYPTPKREEARNVTMQCRRKFAMLFLECRESTAPS